MEPEANESYSAKWYDEEKNVHQTTLFSVKPAGAVLQIAIKDSNIVFLITRSENAGEDLKHLHVVATMQEQLVYMANINLSEKNFTSGSIPVSQLPTGILQITLFNDAWKPLAERISFINNNDAIFAPEAGFSVLGLSKRQRNVLVIDVPDSIQSNLSVAVTDAQIGTDSSDDIISHLLLTGDLHGAVYKPYYYFSDNKNAQQDLDLVMLTHGWRKFNWSDVVSGNLPEIKYPHDNSYVNLSGKIFGATAEQLRDAPYMIAIIQLKDSSRQSLLIPINKNGTFSKSDFTFYDTLKIFYSFPAQGMNDVAAVNFFNALQTPSKHLFINKDPQINITWFDSSGSYKEQFLAREALRVKQLEEGTTLKDVIVKSRIKSDLEKMDDKYTSGLFSGEGNSISFDILDDKSAAALQSVFTYLQGRVAGLQISIDGTNNVSMRWRGATDVEVYLDELKVDPSQMQSVSMSDVAYIKVFRPPFFGTSGGGDGGAIAVYTKKGNDQASNEKKKGIPYKFVAGYSVVKEFYSPNYNNFDERNEAADLRSTLYWNPMIFTNSEKHIVRLEFYNNDVTKSFHVVLEGMSKDGKLTHIEKTVD